MKKLVIACCAVLAIGVCLMAGGWAAGGRLYSSYYDGALHPFSESIADIRHSGWFDGDFDDWIDETVDDALEDTGWVDDWLETRHQAITSPDIPMQSVDRIHKLDFTLTGGDISIETGGDFDLSGDFTLAQSECDGGTWELELIADSGGATITLPDSIGSYQAIDLEIADASVTAHDALVCTELDITVAAGTLDADLLDAGALDIEVGAGNLYAWLAASPDQYRIKGKASMGSITLDDEEIAGGALGTYRYDNRSTAASAPRELDLTVGAGRIDLHTEA